MDEKIKSISCFDMWGMITIILLSLGYISTTPSSTSSVIGAVAFGLGFAYLILVIVFLVFCSRLKKYRYLLIYENCEKVPKSLKQWIFLVLIITAILFILTQFEFIKSSIIYISLAVILSYRHLDSEDRI